MLAKKKQTYKICKTNKLKTNIILYQTCAKRKSTSQMQADNTSYLLAESTKSEDYWFVAELFFWFQAVD